MAVDNVRRKRLPNQPPREVVDKVTRKRITDMTNWKVTIITIIIVTSVLFIVDMMSANNHEKRISALESRLPPEKVCHNEIKWSNINATKEVMNSNLSAHLAYCVIDQKTLNISYCNIHLPISTEVCTNG